VFVTVYRAATISLNLKEVHYLPWSKYAPSAGASPLLRGALKLWSPGGSAPSQLEQRVTVGPEAERPDAGRIKGYKYNHRCVGPGPRGYPFDWAFYCSPADTPWINFTRGRLDPLSETISLR